MAKLQIIAVMKFLVVTTFIAYPSWAGVDNPESSTWATTVTQGYERKTVLQFYLRDNLTGDSLTAVQIAQPTNTNLLPPPFGNLIMADDPLTVSPDPGSKLIGRAQGLYGVASQEELSLIIVWSYIFTEGVYNGSTISILGRNSILQPVREMPVVGGTGVFRMARGYALAHSYYLNQTSMNAIVGYNVTVFHA